MLDELLNNIDERVRILFNLKRFMIATIIYIRGEITISELQKASKLTWGDLDSNLRIMNKHGLIQKSIIITRNGPRNIVKLTEEGVETYEKLAEIIKRLIDRINNYENK